jgi:predicted ATPase
MADGRLLLQIKDAPFERPILAKFASDGTLKMLAYLTILYDPDPPQLVGIEEPENQIHPRLLPELAEECRDASARTQLMVTTHSPFFVNGLKPEELWVLYRDENGYSQAQRAADMRGIKKFMDQGALLGHLWMEGHFEVGDPFTAAGGPKTASLRPSQASKGVGDPSTAEGSPKTQ